MNKKVLFLGGFIMWVGGIYVFTYTGSDSYITAGLTLFWIGCSIK